MYLGIAVALLATLFFSDVAVIITPGEEQRVAYVEKTEYVILLAVALASSALALFSFRRRMFQLRMAAVSAVVSLGLQGWLVHDYFKAGEELVFRYNAIFPVICVILLVLAIRGIFADELMVRSASHLRGGKRRRQ